MGTPARPCFSIFSSARELTCTFSAVSLMGASVACCAPPRLPGKLRPKKLRIRSSIAAALCAVDGPAFKEALLSAQKTFLRIR
eukprot:scaffold7114_cov264-Pinguiococcus_pyrenoidosus.AAC.7